MRKSLAYGTATTLLVTMASLPMSSPTALATEGNYSAVPEGYDAMMEATYGPEPVSVPMDAVHELGAQSLAAYYLAAGMATSIALTVAGVELIRQMHRQPGCESEPSGETDGGVSDGSSGNGVGRS